MFAERADQGEELFGTGDVREMEAADEEHASRLRQRFEAEVYERAENGDDVEQELCYIMEKLAAEDPDAVDAWFDDYMMDAEDQALVQRAFGDEVPEAAVCQVFGPLSQLSADKLFGMWAQRVVATQEANTTL